MHRTDAFRLKGVVTQVLRNGTFKVALANGHQLLGYVAGRKTPTVGFEVGQKVDLSLTPYDLSSGRILVETEGF